MQDVIKHVVSAGKSQIKDADKVGDVLYNRGLFNAVVVAEAISTAQKLTGKANITGEDMRMGLEKLDLSAARYKELGLEGFAAPITGSCSDHAGGGSIFLQQWDGSDWKKTSDLIAPETALVRPLLEAAAAKYVADKPEWKMMPCS